MGDIYLGLVHYPVYNKNMRVVTTAVTNFDIHDIARTCCTYGVKKYYVIHPLPNQRDIIERILDYWQNGYGGVYNPDRREALACVRMVVDIAGAAACIEQENGARPIIVTTDARRYPNTVSYPVLKNIIKGQNRPVLLLFGTGWGIEDGVMAGFDYILEPIAALSPYNHLCVRSAAAIILDRLVGEEWFR